MKTMKTIALLLLTVAAGNSAQAQTQYVTPGVPYTFTATEAVGRGTISYQWFRNGAPIAGATGVSYTLPGSLAYGENVEFTRSAVSDICPLNTHYTNAFTVSFAPEPPASTLTISGIRWAPVNVDDYQTFAAKPDMYTKFYQWNKTTAWAATGTVSGWNSAADQSATWTNNPCPSGWRLPTMAEFQALVSAGSTWAAANAKGNAVAGRFYGPSSATCTLPDNMTNCIFLPAVGYRTNSGSLGGQGSYGSYWSGTQDNPAGIYLDLYSGNNIIFTSDKACGMSIRCVQDL